MTRSLELWPIGNCQVSALIDTAGRFVWGCVPRVDGDPLFSQLINGDEPTDGAWTIELQDCRSITQAYRRNTPVLVTRMEDGHGGVVEITDFCPRFRQHNRTYRPVAWVRRVVPVAGSPRIAVRLRPHTDWGSRVVEPVLGSNHLRYPHTRHPLRLTTDAPVGLVG